MKKIIFIVALLFVSYSNAQNNLIVDNNLNIDSSPAHVYTTFATAIAAATNGDNIFIQPSPYSYGNISITKSVNIYGMGYAPVLNNGEASTVGSVGINSNNVYISGLNVTSSVSLGVNVNNLLVENCYIAGGAYAHQAGNNNVTYRGNVILGSVNLNTSYASLNVTITNNLIQNIGSNALSYFNDTTIFNNNVVIGDQSLVGYVIFGYPNNVICQNNIWLFTNNSLNQVDQVGGTPVIHNNSLTFHYGSATVAALNGTGNMNNQNPFFTTIPANNPYWTATNNYNLGASSVGNNAGTDGNDVGIFNGFYDFDVRGYPTILPYLTEMTISNNMVPAGANLNVNLKANANKTN